MRSRGRFSGSGRRAGLRGLPPPGGVLSDAAISAVTSASAALSSSPASRRSSCSPCLGRPPLQLGELQLELLDELGAALGRAAELRVARFGEQQLEALDLEPED